MVPELSSLPDDIDALKRTVLNLYHQIEGLTETILLLRDRQYGRKSEHATVGQTELFSQAAAIEEVRTVSPEEAATYRIPVRAHDRRTGGRRALPKELPQIEILHDVPEEQRVCCEVPMRRIGEERLEQLGVILPQFFKVVHVRPKYGCGVCHGERTEGPVVRIAAPPPQLIPKSIVTPELLSWVLAEKNVDGQPFYRVEKKLHRFGVEISRETMCTWAQKAAARLLPLWGLLRQELLSGPVIQADETTVQVLDEPGRSPTSKSYLWAYRGGDPKHPLLLFEYHPSRGAEVPLEFLKGYRGVLQTDSHEGYTELGKQPGIVHAGCMAHCRRRFVEAAKVAKGDGLAAHAMKEFFRPLYAVEAEARKRELGPEARLDLRIERSKPVLDKFKTWLDEKVLQTPPSLALGKAIGYALKYWGRLTRFAEDGRIEIDNNLIENAIRPFCVGRRAWLFFDSPEGAKASAVLHSIIETAKAAGLEPYHYLRFVFTRLLTMSPDDEFAALLPYRLKPQDIVLPAPRVPTADPGG